MSRIRSSSVLALALLLAVGASACSRSQPLPVLGTVPQFSLTSSDGSVFASEQLHGKVWVADFIFTHCPGVCPLMGAQMIKLQTALATARIDDVRLVSFTVDPWRDTPEVLSAYADKLHADRKRWHFLSGPHDVLYELIGKGFLLSVAERTPGAGAADEQDLITHSDRFVLVDRQLQIRGYYRPLDEGGLDKLLADMQQLAAN